MENIFSIEDINYVQTNINDSSFLEVVVSYWLQPFWIVRNMYRKGKANIGIVFFPTSHPLHVGVQLILAWDLSAHTLLLPVHICTTKSSLVLVSERSQNENSWKINNFCWTPCIYNFSWLRLNSKTSWSGWPPLGRTSSGWTTARRPPTSRAGNTTPWTMHYKVKAIERCV